jgi:rod shape-determining protein MreC
MQQIAYFIEKYKYFLLFLVLEFIALIFTIQSHSYHKSQFINSANSVTGGLLNKSMSFFEYTSLKSENQKLATENTLLRNKLDIKQNESPIGILDSISLKNNYITSKVIKNNYTKRNNVLTIDKGSKDGLKLDMGVVNSTGIIGVINGISDNYATVLSVLNSHSRINAKLKKSHYFGTLSWNGYDYKTTQLLDIQRQASIAIGDTIVSGGKSTLFPENVEIGTIKSFDFTNKNYKNIEIELFTDMSNLGYIYVIKNLDKEEITLLENNND